MDIFNTLSDMLKEAADGLLGILPKSPFSAFITAFDDVEILATINWIIPVSSFIAIGEAWLVCIAAYYVYQVVLRWIKAVG